MKAALLCLPNFLGVTSGTIRDRGRSARLFLAQSQLQIRLDIVRYAGISVDDPKRTLDQRSGPHRWTCFPAISITNTVLIYRDARHKAGHERGQIPAYQLKPRSLQ